MKRSGVVSHWFLYEAQEYFKICLYRLSFLYFFIVLLLNSMSLIVTKLIGKQNKEFQQLQLFDKEFFYTLRSLNFDFKATPRYEDRRDSWTASARQTVYCVIDAVLDDYRVLVAKFFLWLHKCEYKFIPKHQSFILNSTSGIPHRKNFGKTCTNPGIEFLLFFVSFYLVNSIFRRNCPIQRYL